MYSYTILARGWRLTPVSVTVVNNEMSELQPIWMKKDLERALNLDGEELNEDEIDLVSMMLYYVKDKHDVSGSAYHEMASHAKALPFERKDFSIE